MAGARRGLLCTDQQNNPPLMKYLHFRKRGIMQYMKQQLLEAGLEEEHAKEFLSSLQRSTLARPDAGLTEFHECCGRLQLNVKEVCSNDR